MMSKLKENVSFLKSAWRLISPYWKSQDWKLAWTLTIVIVLLNLGLVFVTVKINQWYNSFYNSLQQKDFPEFERLIYVFCGWAILFIVGAVYRRYLQQMLEIRWRKWLTDNAVNSWLNHKRFYAIELAKFGTDNPDQRISEDLRYLAEYTLSLSLGLLSSTTTLVSFFMILWTLSGSYTFNIFDTSFTVQGYMVWAAFLYAFFGSILTHLIGRRLIRLNFQQQKVEADFRYSLVRVRENSESIALLKGEAREENSLLGSFKDIVSNWGLIMRYEKRLTWFTAAYSQAAVIFPLVVAAPRYFSGAIELGALMQISSAFGRVEGALSWFINSYTNLTHWKATVDRLNGFKDACNKADELYQKLNQSVETNNSSNFSGTLKLTLPDGKILQDNLNFNFTARNNTAVVGQSGKGKSTLFRAIAGLWPFAKGTLSAPVEDQVMFIPQKSYLPIGTLRQVCWYPENVPSVLKDDPLPQLLTKFDLAKFVPLLEESSDWSKKLSGGEQQRVALIRAILKQPAWLFLDEATSSLDEETEKLSFELLQQYLPSTTLVQISHRSSLLGSQNIVRVF